MDLNQLRSFVMVAQHGHLTRAAESLHLSQPALSGHIKALEDEFGVTLFERSSSGMMLTPAGRRLLAEATQIIDAVQHLRQTAQQLHGELTGHLRVGTVLEPAVLRVGDLLVRMRDRYPHVEVELNHVVSSDALARLRAGSLDASFYFGAQPEADLAAIPLRDIVYRVAIPAEWDDELRTAPWETIARRPWIVGPEPSTHRDLVTRLFGEHGAKPEQVVEADNESLINNLVESGVGISLLRDEVIADSVEKGRGIIVWAGAQVTTTLWFVHAAGNQGGSLLAALARVVRATWSADRH